MSERPDSSDDFARILIIRWGSLAYMRNVATLTNYLAQRGHDITIITIEGNKEDDAQLHPAIKWIPLGYNKAAGLKKLLQKSAFILKLHRLLGLIPFDILYIIDSWTLPVIIPAILLKGGIKKTSLVYHTYDWLEPGVASQWHILLEKYICKKADLIINTDRSRARMQKTIYGLEATPLWIQNYLSLETAIPKCDRAERHQLAGADADDMILVIYPTVASSERLTDKLIESFVHLSNNYKLITFYKEDQYYLDCKKLAASLNVSDRIIFLKPVPYSKLLEYVTCSDLGAIFHNEKASSGYYMCNADRLSMFAACGIPFVASDYPNMEALVYKYDLGRCCNPYEPRQIAETILQLTVDKRALSEKKQHIRRMFECHLNYETQGPFLVRALQSLLGKS